MPAERIARRSVAFFLIKSSVNFVAVAVLGSLMAVGLFGPRPVALAHALPAALSVARDRRRDRGAAARPGRRAGRTPGGCGARSRTPRGRSSTAAREAGADRALGQPLVIAGAIGYWVWDNAVLWATYQRVRRRRPADDRADGLPDRPARRAAAAARRRRRDRRRADRDADRLRRARRRPRPRPCWPTAVILFWLPLIIGGISFILLQRGDRGCRTWCPTPASTSS